MIDDAKKLAELRETERSNKAREGLTKRGQNVDLIKSFIPKVSFKGNHISWYNRDTVLLNDAAASNWKVPVRYGYKYPKSSDDMVQVPHLVTLTWVPTLGGTKAGDSPNNHKAKGVGIDPYTIASNAVYQELRGRNSGFASNYSANDVGKYFGAVDSLGIFIQTCIRGYKIASKYSVLNPTYDGKYLCTALGLNFDTIRANLSDMRHVIENMITAMETLPLPVNLTMVERHQWLCKYLFLDRDSIKANAYCFKVTDILQYTVEADALLYTELPDSTFASPANMMTKFKSLYDKVRGVSAFRVLIGDMYKALEGNVKPIVTLDDLSDENIFIHDYQVLSQIQNATFVGKIATPSGIKAIADEAGISTPQLRYQPSNGAQAGNGYVVQLGYAIGSDGYLHFGFWKPSDLSSAALRADLDGCPILVWDTELGSDITVKVKSTTDSDRLDNMNAVATFVTLPSDNPTVDDVVISTRGINLFATSGNGSDSPYGALGIVPMDSAATTTFSGKNLVSGWPHGQSSGSKQEALSVDTNSIPTEIFCEAIVCYNVTDAAQDYLKYSFVNFQNVLLRERDGMVWNVDPNVMSIANPMLRALDFCPKYIETLYGLEGEATIARVMVDFDNVRVLPTTFIEQLHYVCTLSEWNITPAAGNIKYAGYDNKGASDVKRPNKTSANKK